MKKELRQKYLVMRSDLSDSEVDQYSGLIANRCIEGIDWKLVNIVSLYYPIKNEVNILKLLDFCKRKGFVIALPTNLGFAVWEDDDVLQINSWGAKEPSSRNIIVPDLAIIPLVAFDRLGNRLGYGSGFYDRVLLSMPNVRKIGVAYSCQEVDYLPTESHDVPLNLIITEREIIKCL